VPPTLAQIAEHIGASLEGEGSVEIVGVAGLEEAGEGELSFLSNPRYAGLLATTSASAVVCGTDAPEAPCALLRCEDPDLAFARATTLLLGEREHPIPVGVDGRARVADGASVDESARIGPFVTIEAGASVGPDTVLYPGVYVGTDSTIGRECVLHPNAVVYHECHVGDRVILHAGCVIGSDGFRYVVTERGLVKIPQVGTVDIESDVELGANTCVDRARFGETRIGRGTKLDNLVQIAHNVRVGRCCGMAAQVGVSGSTRVGDGVRVGGQAGLAGHLEIGERATLGGRSGITKDVPPGAFWSGFPARPMDEWLASLHGASKARDLAKRLRALEKRVGNLESTTDNRA
jgi:UDP-3-O-[3-hydroxymyristoyl] glucosamine N-acyltransferase